MRMTVLASGSKGNSAVISTSRTSVLVDAGLSCRELLRRMALAGEDPAALNAILITHEHIDHVAGLGVLARRLNIPVFFTEPTHRAWVQDGDSANDDDLREVAGSYPAGEGGSRGGSGRKRSGQRAGDAAGGGVGRDCADCGRGCGA